MRGAGGGRGTPAARASRAVRCRIALALAALLFAAEAAADDCAPVIARVVSTQGNVDLRRALSDLWVAARLDAVLCPGDSVRVGDRSRAGLRLSNETQLRLDQNTTLTLAPAPEPTAFIELLRGVINVFTRTPKPLNIRTPFLNAGVEGTEFVVRVGADRTSVVVFEGQVVAGNADGTLTLASTEAAYAQRGAPPQRMVASPSDAVQWALYYPSVVVAAGADAVVRAADEQARRGDTTRAFATLDAVPPAARSARQRAYYVGLLLQVGSIDAARTEIARMLERNADAADAQALQAIIAVVRNDRVEALDRANRAVQLEPGSPTALLALSYAEQARFEVAGALANAELAATLSPGSALVWARVSELRMANGDLDGALAAAERASAVGDDLARTHTVLGFAHLARADTDRAAGEFRRAIQLDQADYLPRLGLGLALIRQGALAAGRESIEVAASLDPLNALVRSYLGKAYFDEKRSALASTQFEVAKALDPNDPTPWFYDGIQKGTRNQPAAAIDDFLQSIRLNDRRAVYRSQLLLDDDLASRSSSLARVFTELDLPEAALGHAAVSVAVDPTSSSAHRFLSEAAASVRNHEITRASELLQARLRQPLSVTPLQAQLSNDRLFTLQSEGPSAAGFNEFGSLFVANGAGLQVHGIVGGDSTRGEQVIYSGLRGNIGFGFSALQFSTAGARPNGDLKESERAAFAQVALTPATSAQIEFSRRHAKYGDLVSLFDPGAASERRSADELGTARLGVRQILGAASDLLLVFTRQTESTHNDFGGGFTIDTRDASTRIETQFASRWNRYSVVSGISHVEGSSTVDFAGDATQSSPRHLSAYAYSTVAVQRNALYLHAGVSYDRMRSAEAGEQSQVNPKLGVTWHPGVETTVRAAAFRVLKRRINSDAALEPTQVAGIDQYFDDPNGSRSRGFGAAADTRLSGAIRGGISFSGRKLDVPLTNFDQTIEFDPARERVAGAYLHGLAGSSAAWSVRLRYSRFDRTPGNGGAEGFSLARTREVPVSLRLFGPGGLWSSFVVTHVRQNGTFSDASFELSPGRSRFTMTDAVIGYRLPQRQGSASLECTNLFDQSFQFQDIGVLQARFVPHRTCRARVSLDF